MSKGWICEGIHLDGDKLVKRELLRDESEKALAMEALKLCLADVVLDHPWRKR